MTVFFKNKDGNINKIIGNTRISINQNVITMNVYVKI